MIVTLLVTSLITFLLIIFGLAIYLISVLFDESDDEQDALALALDSQDYATTPRGSPNDERRGSNNHDEIGTGCYCTRARGVQSEQMAEAQQAVPAQDSQPTSDSIASETIKQAQVPSLATIVPEASLESATVALENASPEEIRSAELNSKLLQASESQGEAAREGLDVSDQGQETTFGSAAEPTGSNADTAIAGREATAVEAAVWRDTPLVQKSKIISQLGAVTGRQVIDDLDAREMQSGGTALHWCKSRASLDKLAKIGIPLELTNKRGETALHVAVRRHKLQVLIGLIVQGSNIESRNELEETPLITACKVRNIFAVQLLLIYEVNLEAKDKFGNTARHAISVICSRNQAQNQQSPSAAHLILAMLNEIGAKRCPLLKSSPAVTVNTPKGAPTTKPVAGQAKEATVTTSVKSSSRAQQAEACADGCSQSGTYNGNSYNRWPNLKRESLYKRHMFDDIIEAKLEETRKGSAATKQPAAKSRKPSRLLCIDGGGMRGVIVCQILIELEKYLKRPMISYFDWVGGTSVGAFLACAICLGLPLKELRQVCFDVKDEVFSGARPYNSKFLERVLKRAYGTTTRMSDIKGHNLAVTTVLADREPCQLRLFRNYLSPGRLLEKYGYAADTFNNMSGHSLISELQQADNPKRNEDNTKVVKTTLNKTITTLRNTPDPTGMATRRDDDKGKQSLVASKRLHNDSRTVGLRPLKETNETSRASKSINLGEAPSNRPSTPDQVRTKSGSTERKPSSESVHASQQESIPDENDPNPIVWQAVRASTAAPFFFKPYGPYLDGGIISNNPTLDMLHELESYRKVRKFLRKHVKRNELSEAEQKSFQLDTEVTDKVDLVVSLGTGRGRVIGRQAMVDFGQVASGFATVFSPIELVRSIRAARDFFKKLIQQSCHTDDYILDRAQAWCSSLEIPYFRVNPPLATIFSIDDKRDEQLVNALWQTKLYMRSMKDQLKELAELLDGP